MKSGRWRLLKGIPMLMKIKCNELSGVSLHLRLPSCKSTFIHEKHCFTAWKHGVVSSVRSQGKMKEYGEVSLIFTHDLHESNVMTLTRTSVLLRRVFEREQGMRFECAT
jgi:hypothetical protein